MKITKRIEIDGYLFELSLESKSLEAHSMMTDFKVPIEDELDNMTHKGNSFRELLNEAVINHRMSKIP